MSKKWIHTHLFAALHSRCPWPPVRMRVRPGGVISSSQLRAGSLPGTGHRGQGLQHSLATSRGGGLESGAQSRTVCGSFRVLAISFWFKSHRTMWTELEEWTFMNECLMGETFRPVRIPSYIFFRREYISRNFEYFYWRNPFIRFFDCS